MNSKTLWLLPRLLVFLGLGSALVLGGCAFSGAVEQESVEYNKAAADMASQLTLLNVVRAKDHMPIFYTSIARLTGSLQVTASGGLNAQFKTAAPTNTNSSTTATTSGTNTTTANGTSTAPSVTTTTYNSDGTVAGSSTDPGGTTSTSSSTTGPLSSAGTVVTNLMSRAVTSGGTLYSPTVGGQVVGGPSFDIQILDTQQFYQGVLQETPFSTIETFIDQGFDDKLLMRLLIERIEFRLHDELKVTDPPRPAGDLVRLLDNNASDRSNPYSEQLSSYPEDSINSSKAFLTFIKCHQLQGGIEKRPKKPLAPVARLSDDNGKLGRISIKDLTPLDGEKFDLALREEAGSKDADGLTDQDLEKAYKWEKHGYVGEDDDNVFVVRVTADKRAPAAPYTCPKGETPKLPPVLNEPIPSTASQSAEAADAALPRRSDIKHKPQPEQTQSSEQTERQLADQERTDYYKQLLSLPIKTFTSLDRPSGRSSGASATTELTIEGQPNVSVDVSFIFRSPEGLIRFLGRYLEESEDHAELVMQLI